MRWFGEHGGQMTPLTDSHPDSCGSPGRCGSWQSEHVTPFAHILLWQKRPVLVDLSLIWPSAKYKSHRATTGGGCRRVAGRRDSHRSVARVWRDSARNISTSTCDDRAAVRCAIPVAGSNCQPAASRAPSRKACVFIGAGCARVGRSDLCPRDMSRSWSVTRLAGDIQIGPRRSVAILRCVVTLAQVRRVTVGAQKFQFCDRLVQCWTSPRPFLPDSDETSALACGAGRLSHATPAPAGVHQPAAAKYCCNGNTPNVYLTSKFCVTPSGPSVRTT